MKYFLLPVLCCSLSFCFAQDSCMQQQYSMLKKIIQRNIPSVDENYTSNRSEFFIIEINLDEKKDSIINIDFFKKESSVHFSHIQRAIQKIKELWKPSGCGISRIIIPLFIYFQSEEGTLYNYPIDMMSNRTVFNEPSKGTYTFDMISIFVFGTLRKSN